jgi:hypothetical protein
MMGGFALMLIAPSLSILYVDLLDLEHAQVVTGRSILMGVGIVLSSYFWKKGLLKLSVPQLTMRILFGFGLFPLALLLSLIDTWYFYFAFVLYGIAQAGSHLLWNLSGTLFAANEDSSPYSRINILMVGLRGAIAPALGGVMCAWIGPIPMLVFGSLICVMGIVYVRAQEKRLVASQKVVLE